MDYRMVIGGITLASIEMPPLESYNVANQVFGEHKRDIYGKLQSRIIRVFKKWSFDIIATPNTARITAYLDGKEIDFTDYDGEEYKVKLVKCDESRWPRDVRGKGYGLATYALEMEEV